MHTTYRLNASELNESFLEGLKATFQGKDIEIVVSDVSETDYLMRSDENRRRLQVARANIENGANLVEVTIDSLTSAVE